MKVFFGAKLPHDTLTRVTVRWPVDCHRFLQSPFFGKTLEVAGGSQSERKEGLPIKPGSWLRPSTTESPTEAEAASLTGAGQPPFAAARGVQRCRRGHQS